MLRSVFISLIVPLAILLGAVLFYRVRKLETNASGRPLLRYRAAPWLLLGCAAVFLAAGVQQFMHPANQRDAGNLLLFSYIPGAFGLIGLGLAPYLLTFRAVLLDDEIRLDRWPLGRSSFKLAYVQGVEIRKQRAVMHFLDGRQFIIDKSHSGYAYFFDILTMEHSFRRIESQDARVEGERTSGRRRGGAGVSGESCKPG